MKYYKKLGKAVSPVEASMFIQVELMPRSELQEEISFIGNGAGSRN